MIQLPATVRSRRTALGLTQSDLARMSGVSLPTIQNLERGAGNPSLSTMESLLAALGMDVRVDERAADWDALTALGLPLTAGKPRRLVPTLDLLAHHARLAALEISEGQRDAEDRERKGEALHALLLATRSHYPTLHAHAFGRSAAVARILDRPVSGRVVKLGRIALARLSEYL